MITIQKAINNGYTLTDSTKEGIEVYSTIEELFTRLLKLFEERTFYNKNLSNYSKGIILRDMPPV